MTDQYSKANLFGVSYALVNYQVATENIIVSAEQRRSFGVSALAVHGLIECVKNRSLSSLVSRIDMIVPDGMPVTWALNEIHKASLSDRVCGPDLTLQVLEKANTKGLNVYLYGSTQATLNKIQLFFRERFPQINICGVHVDRFRDATPEEDAEDIRKINESGAHIVLVGRGCLRQEVWVAQHTGQVNAVMMAVGAAFDYYAGNLKRAPRWMQKSGLEWFYRLVQEPDRLWKRYLFTNSHFLYLFLTTKLGLSR